MRTLSCLLLMLGFALMAHGADTLRDMTHTAQALEKLADSCDAQLDRHGAARIDDGTCQRFMRAYLPFVDATTAAEPAFIDAAKAIESNPTGAQQIEDQLIIQEFLRATDQVAHVIKRLRWVRERQSRK